LIKKPDFPSFLDLRGLSGDRRTGGVGIREETRWAVSEAKESRVEAGNNI